MKRKIAKNLKSFKHLLTIPYWKNHEFGIKLLRSDKPKFRFMFYLSRYDVKYAENILTWWTFIDIL